MSTSTDRIEFFKQIAKELEDQEVAWNRAGELWKRLTRAREILEQAQSLPFDADVQKALAILREDDE